MTLKANTKILCAAVILLSFSSGQPPECSQYYLPTTTQTPSQLHCFITSCHYVTSTNSLSLLASETQLSDVLSQAQPALRTGQLRRQCLEGFLSLYCLQSYHVCGELVGGVFRPRQEDTGGLCSGDCIQVISQDCGETEWAYLTNIVSQLRGIGILDLPSLVQLEDCNETANADKEPDCFSSLTAATTSPPRECITATHTPPTNPFTSSTPLTTGAIIGICAAVSIALIIIILIILLCLIKRQRMQPNSTPTVTTHNTEAQRVDKALPEKETKLDQQRKSSKAPVSQAHEVLSSGTLMLRASAAHEALLDLNLSPRTTTMAKRIKTSAFLSLSPKQRLQQLEYPRGNICLMRDLWETNFGPVYVGEASGLDSNEALTSIFIKSLRNRASTKLRQQFVIEMTWASGFNHPNIISLLGVCTKEEPNYMIFEHLEYGSLKDFLQSIGSMWFDFDKFLGDPENENLDDLSNQSVFSIEDLTSMACQVASGMDYLTKKAFVLKDLAARNCQVGHNMTIKIANFGLSYDCHSEDYCSIKSHKNTPVPLRWLAPEVIQHNKVSVYSDIWSYGVLLWEIFSFGAWPYSDLSNVEVVRNVLNGYVLPCPDRCPQGVYTLMLRCWNRTTNKRPWFHTIHSKLVDIPGRMGLEERKSFGGAPPTPELERVLRTM